MKSVDERSRFALFTCAILLALGLQSSLKAEFNRTPLLIDAPTADAQRYGSLLFNASVTQRLSASPLVPGGERNLNFSLSPVPRLSVAVTAYTRRDYVLGASYQLLDGGARRPSVALGIHDVGIHNYVSAIGNGDNVWPDEKYEFRPAENLSAFAVGSFPVGSVFRFHAGLGRGRYVGYGNRSQYLNTDYLVGGHHQWAVGLFGGIEARIGRHVSLALEGDGRDVNAGVKANLGPVTAGVALTKIEGFLSTEKFQRVSAAVSYQANNIIGRRTALKPPVQHLPQFGALSGKITDSRTGAPLPAQITIQANESDNASLVKNLIADSTGEFRVSDLRPGSYLVSADNPGYLRRFAECLVNLAADGRLDIALDPLDMIVQPQTDAAAPPPLAASNPGIGVQLKPVYFHFDQSDLTGEALQTLKENAAVLNRTPGAKTVILGRTCEVGTDEYNLKLGERRARAVYDFLVRTGIEPARLSYRSLGRSTTEAGTALWSYRRCDFESEQTFEAR
jgi:peptidoglycan-associated lipoprotein